MDQRIISTIDDLLNRVPGYSGYRSKEDRRDDDRRLRESIASKLEQTISALSRASATLAERRNLQQISAVERLVSTTRHLADRVRTASYGYGGIFTDQSVDEYALDQLRQFDVAFQQEVEHLAELGTRIATSPEGPLDVDINAYQDELNRLGQLFDARATVVETARPNRDAAVLSLLEKNPPSPPSPLAGLKRGDALALAGQNYLVDATVTLTGPEGSARLSRIGTDPGGQAIWLLGGSAPGIQSARLVEAADDPGRAGSGRTAQVTVDAASGSQEGVGGRYAYTAGTGGAVTFWYAIGDQVRSFQGESIAEDDVEIYGQA